MAEVNSLDETQALSAAPTPEQKKKRFRFTTQLDVLLCKAVSETCAHAPPVNKKMELMTESHALFLSALPDAIREAYGEPKVKSLSDSFELIFNQRTKEDSKNRRASGISEEQSELNELLDDLILQRGEHEEVQRREKEEKTEQDKKLDTAAKEIRSNATSRMSRTKSDDSDESEKKKRKVVTIDSDEEEIELLKESLAERRENERKRMELDQERLNVERETARAAAAKAKKDQELEEKRLEIEEGRLEIERQKAFADLAERRAGIEERKTMVGALSMLAKKFVN